MKNVKKRVLAHLAAAAVVAPLAILGTSGSASATADDGWVTWENQATGRCLMGDYTDASQNHYMVFTDSNCKSKKARWHEVQQWNGAYQLRWAGDFRGDTGMCLDSNKAGSVYLLPCEKGNNNQVWAEIKTSTGWELANVQTGRVLDSNRKGSVYTNWNEGDSNKYQRWG